MYSPPRYVVIGYGDDLYPDNGAGRHAANLVDELSLPGVRVISAHQLLPQMVAEVANASIVFFIEAFPGDGDGYCRLVRLSERVVNRSKDGGFSPADLLVLVREAYGRIPEAWLVGVPTEEIGAGKDLSARAMSGAAQAAEYVRDMLWVRRVTEMRQTPSIVYEENRGWA